MKTSEATTVQEYLDALPEERRIVLSAARDLVLRSLPEGYAESVRWGMISYEVPPERCPDASKTRPLSYAALAVRKNHFALYLVGVCQSPDRTAWLRAEFERAGKRLDVGRACVRFRRIEDLPVDVIGRAIGAIPADVYVAAHKAAGRR